MYPGVLRFAAFGPRALPREYLHDVSRLLERQHVSVRLLRRPVRHQRRDVQRNLIVELWDPHNDVSR